MYVCMYVSKKLTSCRTWRCRCEECRCLRAPSFPGHHPVGTPAAARWAPRPQHPTIPHTHIHTYIHTYKHLIKILTTKLSYIYTYIHTYIHNIQTSYIETNIHTYILRYILYIIHTYIHTYITSQQTRYRIAATVRIELHFQEFVRSSYRPAGRQRRKRPWPSIGCTLK